MSLEEVLLKEFYKADDKHEFCNKVKTVLATLSPQKENPVDLVLWVDIDKVKANEYNPNQVADAEMKLLHTSISHDGYTQPVVTVYDETLDRYIIVDGFHRYAVLKRYKDIFERCHGRLPITVLKKGIKDRMASTIRHNRARGKHAIQGMSQIVFNMLEEGWDDKTICKELGMELEELIRLKHITGFSKLFANAEYRKAWKTKRQIEIGLKDEINKTI